MNIDLSKRRVIVTGASRGIGYAIASAFAENGARVAICARDAKASSDNTLAHLKAAHKNAKALLYRRLDSRCGATTLLWLCTFESCAIVVQIDPCAK